MREWMDGLGMWVGIDAIGNLRGVYSAKTEDAPTFYIGSHLDTVPGAGRYDGILGVVLGVALIEALEGEKLGFNIEVMGFSEEEGVRFKKPFFGSLALIGRFDKVLL